MVQDKKGGGCEDSYKVPYLIIMVWTNGTVTIRWGAVQEFINIRLIKTRCDLNK